MVDPDRPPIPYIYFPPVHGIELTSDDIEHGQRIDDTHHADSMGMSGDNLSPHLSWSGVPDGTQSLAVTCFDPDAPTGSGFWHWSLFDLPASTTELPRGAGSGDQAGLPAGAIHARNDAGGLEYIGMAPPGGSRRPPLRVRRARGRACRPSGSTRRRRPPRWASTCSSTPWGEAS